MPDNDPDIRHLKERYDKLGDMPFKLAMAEWLGISAWMEVHPELGLATDARDIVEGYAGLAAINLLVDEF